MTIQEQIERQMDAVNYEVLLARLLEIKTYDLQVELLKRWSKKDLEIGFLLGINNRDIKEVYSKQEVF